MGAPAATADSQVVGVDTHIVMVPTPGGPVPTPLPHPFSGMIRSGTISTVKIGGRAAAIIGSVAENNPQHIPTPPGTTFQRPPTNRGTIKAGSSTVIIGGKGAARIGDQVETCGDPSDAPVSSIIGPATTVMLG